MWTSNPGLRHLAALSFVLSAGACTSVPPDRGLSEVIELTADRGVIMTGQPGNEQPALTTTALNLTEAIRFTLLNNPELRALHSALGFSAAELYDAGRIQNPIFSLARLQSDEPGSGRQLSLGIVATFSDLVTLPSRTRMANAEFAAAKQEFAFAVLNLASETEARFHSYVAAKQVAALREQTHRAASISLKMAERYHDAGNLPPKALALEQAANAEARLAYLKANSGRFEARAYLARVLGVSPAGPWDTDTALPPLPQKEESIDALLTLAWNSRLDFSAAKIRADYLADKLNVTNWSRWLGDLVLGYEREREADGAVLKGPSLELELPVFSSGQGELLRADAELKKQMAELVALRTEIEHEVLLAYEAMKNAKAQVLVYKDALIPARIEATRRAQEEENFMLIGVFELIETKQEEYNSYEGYIEAARDYWLARTELARAIGRRLAGEESGTEGGVNIDQFLRPGVRKEHQVHQMDQMQEKEAPAREPMSHDDHGMNQEMKKVPTPEPPQSTATEHHH